MNKLLLFFLACILTVAHVSAQNTLTITDPQRFSSGYTGYITDPVFEVTPQGGYARVDMIFTIDASGGNQSSASTQLEAVLNFTLPDGSFIHDSWLWLNDSVIIRADVVEKNRAVEIYEGIVNRRRDPSLLVKTGENSYKLNVYPLIKTTYPRKVKLSYSTPIKWHNNDVKLELPMALLRTSSAIPDFTLKVNQNPLFSSPSLMIQDYNSLKQSSVGPQDILKFTAQDIKYNDLTLMYQSSIGSDVLLTTFPTGQAEGVYQLVIPPTATSKTNNRNLAIILDMDDNSYKAHSLADVKSYLRSSLLNNYSEEDSFNIFYIHQNNIINTFNNNWVAINKNNVNQAINSIPLSLAKNSALYKDLLIQGLQFCATKSKLEAEVLLISQNYDYSNDQNLVNTMFDDIKTNIGGYKNKINVINCSKYYKPSSGGSFYANAIWYSKLSLATNGIVYGATISYNNTVDVAMSISEIAKNAGETTSAFNIDVNLTNGFTHSEYTVGGLRRLNLSDNYVLIGKYYGDVPTGTKVDFQALFPSGNVTQQYTINNILTGSNNSVKEWSHLYIEDLVGQNNKSYVQEIIDSSINNRVLCTYTAFLAVETGDTITTNADDNPGWNTSIDKDIQKDKLVLKAYPNPFSNNLTLELPEGAVLIEVYDITGKRIVAQDLPKGENKFVWNGKTDTGADLAAGTYIVIVRTDTERFTLKVMKR